MTLEVTTITTLAGLDALEGPWRRLLDAAGNDLPFLLPEWVSSWWRCFRQDSAVIRDSLRLTVVREAGSAEVLGILPLMLTERPPFGPVRARMLGFLGADRYVTELRAPIVHPSRQGEVARAVAAHVLEESWDWVAWQGLDPDSELARELAGAMPLRWGKAETASVLPLAPSWEQFRSGLKRNIKESLRRCANSLKRDGLHARLAVAERPADVDRALDTFLQLHGMRARDGSGTHHPDRFGADRPRRFLRQVCERLSARGEVRIFTLLVDDEAVAARVAFKLPQCLYLYYSGYDPAWGKYSVATTLVAEAIKYAIGEGVPRVHLSMGQDVSKSRWGPETSLRYDALWLRPRPKSRAAHWLYSQGKDNPLLERAVGHLLPRRRFD